MAAPPRKLGGLTARQIDVARLVAAGLTNRQIGERLVISERTVDAHVTDIMNAFGYTARGQIIALAATAAAYGVPIGELFPGAWV